MPNFRFIDPGNVLGGGLNVTAHLSIARALTLLALACAPNPGSRYQPGSTWAVVKYATAIEPRMRPTGSRQALVNAGIADLDPHQKTILADELGVAFALARIDSLYGIDGLYDCYGLHQAGLLNLHLEGRHRRMPDFLLLLKNPLSGSRLIFLECKGSTRSHVASQQLKSACFQLDNVANAFGTPCPKGAIPRVAIALTAHPGRPALIEISDPEEPVEFPPAIEAKLRANYVALEVAAFGDLAAADRIRSHHELPSFSGFGIAPKFLQESTELRFEQTAWGTLPAWSRSAFKEALDESFLKKLCLARLKLSAKPSRRARMLQRNPGHRIVFLPLESEAGIANDETTRYVEESDGGRLQFEDRDRTAAGSLATIRVDIWRVTRA